MSELQDVLDTIDNSARLEGSAVKIVDRPAFLRGLPHLVEMSALETGGRQGWSRFIVRSAASDQGILPSSIQGVYAARGRGELPATFTTPALNLRVLSFDAARAVFRVARKLNAGPFIFEIARSEIGYTDQRPAEYATNILAAALMEGWSGPVFLQGDHFQVSAKKLQSNAEAEKQAVKDLSAEAIASGFFNIDIDTSTLVDVTKPTIAEQQEVNFALSAEFAAAIRQFEPSGVTVSIGGEIGEVGGHNSTAEELEAFMGGFRAAMGRLSPGKTGLSKISIQTGTSHGGTILPNGSLARVNIDFETLRKLSELARTEFGLGGAVQHGASTLPEDAFHRFVESEALEVHLATNFMTIFYENCPEDLRREMYAWLDQNSTAERKPGMTDGQFYYKTRKNAIGPFKKKIYALSGDVRATLSAAWEKQFETLFALLGVKGTRGFVDQFVQPIAVAPDRAFYLGPEAGGPLADDLQD